MTANQSVPGDRLAALEDGLAQLTDLFRRRLYEDREKKRAFDALYAQLEAAQRASRGEVILPLLREICLVIDRVDSHDKQDSADFVASLGSELIEILRRQGVEEVSSSGRFDPRVHEAVEQREVDSAEEAGSIIELRRRGFIRDGALLRPAQVTVGYVKEPVDASGG